MKKRYPVKQDLNLAQKERASKDVRQVVVVGLFLAAAIGLFCKFAVVDRLQAVSGAEAAAARSEQLLAQTQAATADYDAVMEEYRSYTLAHQALGTGADPLECLDLIESQLIAKSQVSAFVVSDSVISVQLSGVTLAEVSAIYTNLLAREDLVDSVQVYTAATGEKTGDRVEATMTIHLVLPETEEVTAP